MSRPLSEDRRAALLDAAALVFSEHGVAAPTALISKTAQVSEGSFFTYFKTKDELLKALYRELRLDLGAAIGRDFPRRAGVRARLEHVFARYVAWGVANPVAKKALRHVSMARAITPEVRAEGSELFAEVERLQSDAIAQRLLRIPPLMASATLKALAEMTMDLIAQHPDQAERFTTSGFLMLWAALNVKG